MSSTKLTPTERKAAMARLPHASESTFTVAVDRLGRTGDPTAGKRLPLKVVVIAGPEEGREVPLDVPVTIGTDSGCDLVLTDRAVSRRHVALTVDREAVTVRDLGSRNGTFLATAKISEAELPVGAVLTIGQSAITIQPRWYVRELPPSTQRRFGEVLGESLATREIFAILERVAPTDVTVLVEGESGTGKELVAGRFMRRRPAHRCPTSCSTVAPFPGSSPRASCSVTSGAHSPARSPIASARSPAPTAARCASTSSASCRSISNRSCSACWRAVSSSRWAPTRHERSTSASSHRRTASLFSTYRQLKHEGLFNQGPLSLRCAAPECGCKITFAPKMKGTGDDAREYRYYRCADGRRAHVDRGERQVNVREHDILDALGGAVDLITITDDIADAVAHALNSTHREAKAARLKAAGTYRLQLAALDEKENSLVDVFTSGNIDADLFKRQQHRVRDERDALFAKLRETDASIDDSYLVTAHRVLELAKTAKALWNGRSPEEKRDFLEKLVRNPRLDGRTVRYD